MADLSEYDHVGLLHPSNYLSAADLKGKDVTVTIESINPRDELQLPGKKKTIAKPVITFKAARKQFVLNKTNAHSIAKIHGPIPSEWIGKAITLYPTRVRFGPDMVDAVRVREKK